MNISSIADRLIPPPNMATDLVKSEFVTDNIISEVLIRYATSRKSLAAFAPYLKGKNIYETAGNVWAFIKNHIAYQVDPGGLQDVKSPPRLWYDKIGDCKSFSLFAASALHCLGINCRFRFAGYSSRNIPTHVYVIVLVPGGGEIIVDAVLNQFNKQKRPTYSVDLPN